MLFPIFQWIADAPCFAVMRDSKWAFPIVEMAHLLSLAILGGTVLLVNLGLLGIRFRREENPSFARELWPLFLGSLATMILSGVVLLSAEAIKCYYHPAFRLKMAILALAVVFSFTAHRRVVQAPASIWSRPAAVVSLMLWLGVGLAGRAIGFL
jgi:hypothetical protein